MIKYPHLLVLKVPKLFFKKKKPKQSRISLKIKFKLKFWYFGNFNVYFCLSLISMNIICSSPLDSVLQSLFNTGNGNVLECINVVISVLSS